jgi:hypothetical protein
LIGPLLFWTAPRIGYYMMESLKVRLKRPQEGFLKLYKLSFWSSIKTAYLLRSVESVTLFYLSWKGMERALRAIYISIPLQCLWLTDCIILRNKSNRSQSRII